MHMYKNIEYRNFRQVLRIHFEKIFEKVFTKICEHFIRQTSWWWIWQALWSGKHTYWTDQYLLRNQTDFFNIPVQKNHQTFDKCCSLFLTLKSQSIKCTHHWKSKFMYLNYGVKQDVWLSMADLLMEYLLSWNWN